jgi:hypothetical protein
MQSLVQRVFSIERTRPLGVPLALLAPVRGTAPVTFALSRGKDG